MGAAEQVRVLAGRYRLDSVIGRGGMGIVWHAQDQLLNRDVAVKELGWAAHLDEEAETARRDALREARTAARLSHPNVVSVFDIITEDDRPWIVMEYLPYPSLRDVVREDGALTPAVTAQIGLGILAALDAAHSQGILHRDVKPGNVLVGPDGSAVLTDFGIARAADSQVTTTVGTILGSPSYICPERARGEKTGPPGDLWGLGATLYTAVEGHPPFERGSAVATLTAVVMDDPAPAAKAGPLEPVITGLLRKDPEERLEVPAVHRMLANIAAGTGPNPLLAGTGPNALLVGTGPRQLLSRPASDPGHAPVPAPASDPGRASDPGPAPVPGPKTPPEPVVPEPVDEPRGGGGREAPGKTRSWAATAIAVAAAVAAIGAALAIGVLLATT